MHLYAKVIGTGHPLLVLHGLFGMSDNWVGIGKGLSRNGFAVHLVDLRNHGRSPHSDHHGYGDMCDDLLSYLDREDLHKVSVIGHSMGGKVAMTLALRHPAKLRDMVVVDMAPATYCCHEGSLHAIIMDHLMAMDLSTYPSQSAIMAEMESRLKNRTLVMFLGKNIKREGDGRYAWRLNLPVLKSYLQVLYAGMEDLGAHAPSPVKTLFIKGNNSDYIQPQHEFDIQRFFPDAEIVGVDNAGHWLHAEHPRETLRLITNFLGR